MWKTTNYSVVFHEAFISYVSKFDQPLPIHHAKGQTSALHFMLCTVSPLEKPGHIKVG